MIEYNQGESMIQKMSQKSAEEIAKWHYEEPYDFYDMSNDEEDLHELLCERGDHYFEVIENHVCIGFYSIMEEDDHIEIGLGLRPDFTGKGHGKKFLEDLLDYISLNYEKKKIVLRVASFNSRAIHLYEKCGFNRIRSFVQATNGSFYEFIEMELCI